MGDGTETQPVGQQPLPWTATPPPGEFKRNYLLPWARLGAAYELAHVGPGEASHGVRFDVYLAEPALHIDRLKANNIRMPIFFLPRLEGTIASRHQSVGMGVMVGLPLPDELMVYANPMFNVNRYNEEWRPSFDLLFGLQAMVSGNPRILVTVEYAPLGLHAGLEDRNFPHWYDVLDARRFLVGVRGRF